MEIARLVAELVKAFADLAVEAFADNDPRKMKRVLDVLPPGNKLKSEVIAEMERQQTAAALKRKDSK